MTGKALELLANAFAEQRPVVLVAGQNFSAGEGGRDFVLEALLQRLGRQGDSRGWRALLDSPLSADDMTWLSERFDRSVPSEDALRLFDVSWSAVFTSAVDPRFVRRFETRGRQPEAILSKGTYARVSRSTSRPPIHYLLGKADEESPELRAPRTNADLMRRLATHAAELTNRIAETATARGVVVISGLDPTYDWLPVEALLAVLSQQPGVQVIWFGAKAPTTEGTATQIAQEMVSAEALFIADIDLAKGVRELEALGKIQVDGSAAPDEPGLITLENGAIGITPALRLRIEASAAIVDDEWTQDQEPTSTYATAEAFKRFHGDLDNFRKLIEGIGRGFAIQRDFEELLWSSVERKLAHLSKTDGTVLVHGQSSTGKTIAVARLAWKLRRQLKLPVLVATNRLPTPEDVEPFCSEAERAGASATIIICDANQSPQRYRDLAGSLQSRGRRTLVIGTCYLVDGFFHEAAKQFVKAPAEISSKELKALNELTTRAGYEIEAVRQGIGFAEEGPSILAMLYRTVSASRGRITAGLSAEARFGEALIRARAKKVPAPKNRTVLADQLVAAGLMDASSPIFNEEHEQAALGQDAAGRLIDYVMVVGRLGCALPLNLLIRALSRENEALELSQVIHLFASLDLFRWKKSGAEGADLLISPRLRLEADLVCRRRLGDRSREIGCLVELIKSVRPSGVDRRAERAFLLDLLQKLDKEGPDGGRYRDGYLIFANTLRDLRETQGVVDAALMLRESVFRRQVIWSLDGPDSDATSSEPARFEILDSARDVIEKAIRLIDDGDLSASKRVRLNLLVERASIYGYLAVQRSKAALVDEAWSDYLAARTASTKAVAVTDDYYPVDIALWTACDVLDKGGFGDERRAEMLADVYATLDLVDTSTLGVEQKSRYHERRVRVGNVLKDKDLTDEALHELERIAPAAATFLIAKRRVRELDNQAPPYSLESREIARDVANFISNRTSFGIGDDLRCQRLLLQLRWIEATGNRVLRGERGQTPADPVLIADLLAITSALNERAGAAARNGERFLEAVLCWLSKDTTRASHLWTALSRDTEFEDRSRVVRRLLVTNQDGTPTRFRGRIEAPKGRENWRVRVDGVPIPIALLSHEFREEDLAEGRNIRDFGIAFNYVGPIADPLWVQGKR